MTSVPELRATLSFQPDLVRFLMTASWEFRVDAATAPTSSVAGVFGRAIRRRDLSNLSAFYSWQLVKVRTRMKSLTA